MTERVATRSNLPVLGPLSPIGRTAVLLTLGFSIAAIVLDFGLHAEGTLVFLVPPRRSWVSPGSSAYRRVSRSPYSSRHCS